MTTVITSLLTSGSDPQRPGVRLPATLDPVRVLADSLRGVPLVVLADQVDEGTTSNITVVRAPAAAENVYHHRWRVALEYLKANDDISDAWLVDATDVELINPPPEFPPNTLYLGFEHTVVGCQWMRKHHPSQREWIERNADRTLLNPGITGGRRDTLINWLADLDAFWSSADRSADVGDMGEVNEVAYSWGVGAFGSNAPVQFGPRISSPYKLVWGWDYSNTHSHSAFRHK